MLGGVRIIGKSANSGKEEIPPFLCPSPCDAGIGDDETLLPEGQRVLMKATEVFRCVGEAKVLAWKPDNTQCLREKKSGSQPIPVALSEHIMKPPQKLKSNSIKT